MSDEAHILFWCFAAPPLSTLQCWVEMVPRMFIMQLICRWDGGYPEPKFLWTQEPGNVVLGMSELGVELLNRSQMVDGRKFKCVGIHILKPEAEDSCVIQIRESGLPRSGIGVYPLPFGRTI